MKTQWVIAGDEYEETRRPDDDVRNRIAAHLAILEHVQEGRMVIPEKEWTKIPAYLVAYCSIEQGKRLAELICKEFPPEDRHRPWLNEEDSDGE